VSAQSPPPPNPAYPRTRPYPPPPRPEPKWPAELTIGVAIVLQLVLPARLTPGPFWIVPALEAALAVVLTVLSPRAVEGANQVRRNVSLALIALVSAANIYALARLSTELLRHQLTNGPELIGAGVLIWLTNFLIFGLWYWELDRGGPGLRAAGEDRFPDLLFVQMNDDRIMPLDWRPGFVDYMYVSLTNATAFSPTDTMPLTPMAKGVMGVQALVSLVTIGLIVARSINIL